MSSRTLSVRSAKLLRDEKLGSIILRLMIAMNDIGITNSSMAEWEKSDDPKKKARWRGGVLYFGRVQSAHLFEALSIIDEIKKDRSLMAAVDRADRHSGVIRDRCEISRQRRPQNSGEDAQCRSLPL
jgi:hypothetical protein